MPSTRSGNSLFRFAVIAVTFVTGLGVGWYWQRPAGGPSIRFVAEKHLLFGLGVRRSGYLDGSGRMAIKPQPQFESVTEFQEGRAFVKSDERWTMIDLAGNPTPAPVGVRYTGSGFSQGLTTARSTSKRDQTIGVVDCKGNWVIEPGFEGVSRGGNGRIMVRRDGRTGLWKKRRGRD